MSSSTFSTYMSISSNLARYQTMTADDPTVAQATKYYQANIGSITTPAQFVNNSRIFNYAMNAFGLGDMTYAKSLIQKVLEQGTSSSTALANTLNNPKILALAQAFDFKDLGSLATQQASATTGVVSNYVMQTLETNEATTNPGVQLALYFQQNASKITNGYSILADSNLLSVVQTTLGISSYTSEENIDQQANSSTACWITRISRSRATCRIFWSAFPPNMISTTPALRAVRHRASSARS